MQAGDLVILVANVREAGRTLAISATGGQAWTSETTNTTNTTQRIFWARYNGTWSANPSVANGGGGGINATTLVMHVFRPTSSVNTWAVDVALTNGSFTAVAGGADKTITGINTVTPGALVFATWATADNNTWALQTAGWANAGGTQYRNLDSNDSSQSAAYQIMPTAGATGNVTNRQTANGNDAGNSAIIAFREVPTTYFSRASTAWNTGTTWSVAGCGGVSAGATPVANANVVICTGHTVPLNTNTPSLGSLTIQAGGTLDIGDSGAARTLTVAGDVDNSGTLQYATAANHAISIGGQFTIAGGGLFTSAAVAGARTLNVTGLISNAGTFRFAGTAAMTVTATGGITNSSVFDVSTLSNVSHTLNIAGNLSNSGTMLLASDADSLVNTTFNGTVQAVGGSSGATFNNVTTGGTTTVTLSQPQVISGTLTLAAGTTLNAGALSHTLAGNFTNNGGTFDPSTGTFTFNGAGAQTIGGSAGTTFHNLVTFGSAAVTVTQPLAIGGDLTLGNGTTFSAGASSHTIAGNFSNNGAAFSSTGLFTFNGGSAQVIGGTTGSTFNNLTINSAGVTLSGVNTTTSGVLTFTAGIVTTGANVMIVTGNCPGSVSRTSGHVAGPLRLRVPAGSPSCLFPVGDAASGYRPVSLAFTTVSAAGDVTVSVTQADGEHPDIGTSTIESAYNVNRYWTLANSGTTFASAIATFNYLPGDADAGTDQTAFIAGRYAAGWTYPSSTAGAGSVQASGLLTATLAGDYVLGETTPVLFSHWRMDQPGGWNGTPGEVLDHGTGGMHGTASGLVTRPTTSNLSPAIAGSPGTCQYGVFTRSNKDYVALPGGYPSLASAPGGFTITAWINTTNSTLPGQRILIDDETNSSPGGWGFSVGETTAFGAGGLRFFYRQPSVYILDTVPIPSNQWLFVALSVSLAAGVNASSATIYAYDTSGVLVTSNTGTFTWTAGSDAGTASIGGETNASGEGTNAFGFSGNLDEIRVYQRPLSQQRINLIRQDARSCALLDHIRIEHDGIGLTCAPETVTVKACSDAACSATYSGIVTTTLTPTGWVGGDTINFSGSTTVDLRRTTAGVVTVGAPTVGTVPAPASSTRCFNGLVETCDIDFKDTGFLFSAIPAQTAGTTSATHTVQAVRTDNSTGACVGLFTGNVPNIELASECVNPGICAGEQVTLTNNGSGVIAANDGGAVGSWTARTLTFGANSTADFTFSYPDVGAMRLHARYNINGSGNYMTGASSNFVVKPAGFTVTNIRRAADNFANPAAADAGGAVFIKAGDDIALTVTAVNSLNAATPNFGKETPAEGVKLTSALVPGLGLTTDPGLGNGTIAGSAFTAGAAPVNNVTWSEVGIITITPSIGDSDYLGAGDVTGTATGNIGRFTPFQFDVSTNMPAFAAACGPGGFTYIGQPFVYDTGMEPVLTVTARAKGGVLTTSNYKGTSPAAQAFFKLTNASLTGKAYTAATGTLDASGVTAPDPSIVDNGNGTATLTFNSGTGLFFNRAAAVAPFDAEVSLAINVIDADAVAFPTNPARFGQASAGNGLAFSGGKTMRFGRLRLGGSSGSQVLPLRLPLTAQYWNGTFYVTNTDDSCTTLNTTNVGLGNHLGNLGVGETLVTAVTSPLASGLGTITLGAPGVGNNGSVDVALNLGAGGTADACPAFAPAATGADRSYLRGQWCGAAATRDPAARARFGIRRGDETIYIRESVN
ncbi:MAG: DUF6701 domain-containing protein [Burkholderiales bacterium]